MHHKLKIKHRILFLNFWKGFTQVTDKWILKVNAAFHVSVNNFTSGIRPVIFFTEEALFLDPFGDANCAFITVGAH